MTQDAAARHPDPARTFAVVVGLDEYGFGKPRPGLAAQAAGFARWLRSRGVPAANIRLLTSPLLADPGGVDNRLATAENVRVVLHDEVLQHDGDLFWLYWAGHGQVVDGERRLFVQNATAENLLNVNLTRLGHFYRSERARRLGRQIFIVDACQKFHGVASMPVPAGISQPPDSPEAGSRQATMYASPYGERAVQLSHLEGGVFSAALLDVLNSTTDDLWPPDLVRLCELVKQRAEQLAPDKRAVHHPIVVDVTDEYGAQTPVHIVPPASPTTLSTTLWTGLIDLASAVGPIPAARIVDTLWRSVNTVAPMDVDDAATLETTLHRLDLLVRQPGRLPPVLAFIEHLDARYPEPTPFGVWADHAAAELRVDALLLAQERSRAAEPMADAQTFITMRAEPVAEPAELFRLSASIQRDGTTFTMRCDDPEPCRSADLKARCETMLSRLGTFLPTVSGTSLTFEFLLPWSLLNIAVDTWRPTGGGAAGRQLGLRGKVVVRSLDRLRFDEWTRNDWRGRWALLAGPTPPSVVHLHRGEALPDYYDSTEQRTHLILDRFDQDSLADHFAVAEDVVCLVLSYPYRACTEPELDGLQVAIAAGLPAAVWCGEDGDLIRLRAAVEEVDEHGGLACLPEHVYQTRRRAANPAAPGYGAGIALLWDDPNRIPELNTPLRPPAGRGSRG